MALRLITLDPGSTVPDDVDLFLHEAESRIDAYLARDIKKRAPRFVPSNSVDLYHALHAIREEGLADGKRFCEWGSGFGITTCLAAMLGFDALGIEIESHLANEAESLAKAFHLPARFECRDIVPNGFEYHEDGKGNAVELVESGLLPSQQLDRDEYFLNDIVTADFDIIFCYPWPGEAALIETLFETTAEEGTLLITYCETGGAEVRRLVLD